ncbi:MAG: hypothetical protein JOS17DRAFT_738310 [Linnemannia elongata]|nr:MAG: hypothetical protein JOS17DRAFT_738310 [Linnemannia elongata]
MNRVDRMFVVCLFVCSVDIIVLTLQTINFSTLLAVTTTTIYFGFTWTRGTSSLAWTGTWRRLQVN